MILHFNNRVFIAYIVRASRSSGENGIIRIAVGGRRKSFHFRRSCRYVASRSLYCSHFVSLTTAIANGRLISFFSSLRYDLFVFTIARKQTHTHTRTYAHAQTMLVPDKHNKQRSGISRVTVKLIANAPAVRV